MSLAAGFILPVTAQENVDTVSQKWLDQEYNIGVDLGITRENSTASVSVIKNDAVNQRSAKNVGNALIGHGKGLITRSPHSMCADSRASQVARPSSSSTESSVTST